MSVCTQIQKSFEYKIQSKLIFFLKVLFRNSFLYSTNSSFETFKVQQKKRSAWHETLLLVASPLRMKRERACAFFFLSSSTFVLVVVTLSHLRYRQVWRRLSCIKAFGEQILTTNLVCGVMRLVGRGYLRCIEKRILIIKWSGIISEFCLLQIPIQLTIYYLLKSTIRSFTDLDCASSRSLVV